MRTMTGATLGVLACGALVTVGDITSSGDAAAKRRAPVEISADPQSLELVPLPCLPAELTVGMTNTTKKERFGDMTITAPTPLATSRPRFTSYLPAGYTATANVPVTAERDTSAGDHELRLEAGGERLRVPVSIQPVPPKGPGDNLAVGENADASSTHGNFDECGGVDGNRDSDGWNTETGWNDGTRSVFPDHYGVPFIEPTPIDRIEVYTLDSEREPAATHGLRDWDLEVRVDGEWQVVDEVRGNEVGHVVSSFDAVTADAVRIVITDSNDHTYSRVVELEIYATS